MKILKRGVLVLSGSAVWLEGWTFQPDDEDLLLPRELMMERAREAAVLHALQAAGFRLPASEPDPQAVDWAAERAAAEALQRFRVMPQRHQQCGHLRLDVLGPGRPGAWARLKAWAAGLIGARR